MKKIFLLLLIPFFLVGCNFGLYDFLLINNTEYDVVLIDESYVDKPEYELPKNSTIHIKHENSSHFSIKNNKYPIKIYNNFTSCQIEYLKTYDLQIFNQTGNQYILTIDNDFQGSYTITANQNTSIKIYTNITDTSILHLTLNNQFVDNYIFQDNKIVIF